MVRQGETSADDVWFYTHWAGSNIKEIAQRALARRQRWGDASYLARIVFCEMIADSDDLKGETGYAISTSIGDNEHPIVVIDCEKRVVHLIGEEMINDGRLTNRITAKEVTQTWTFEEFIAAKFEEVGHV